MSTNCDYCNSYEHTSADHLALAETNSQWGPVGSDIPANFYQVYLKEGVVAKEIVINCDVCGKPATDCSNAKVECVEAEEETNA